MSPNSTYGTPMNALSQTVAYTGTAAVSTSMPSNVQCIRVVATTDCFINISVAGTAALVASSMFISGNSVGEYFGCPPLGIVSVIQSSAGGNCYITPFA